MALRSCGRSRRGRYVAVAESSIRSRIATDARIRSFEAFRAETRIHVSARRETSLRHGRLSVVFHDDVSFDDARRAIAEAGATIEDPLVIDFAPMRLLSVLANGEALERLGADDRVLTIVGTPEPRVSDDNVDSARLSRVDAVHATPYGLTGEGVVLSLSEIGVAWTHVEFGGRLIVEPYEGERDSGRHATHVAGTIMSGGTIQPHSRGMAPRVIVRQFRREPRMSDWMRGKRDRIAVSGAIADNNSWGIAEGWGRESSGLVWNDRSQWYGAYHVDLSAGLDEIARSHNILFVYSAGNDGQAPAFGEWAEHRHVDAAGSVIAEQWFCYSKNGSGSDCPSTPCGSGRSQCETEKHHPTEPFDTMSVLGSAKNVIAVGAVDGEANAWPASSRGPAKDGRVKPDLVARGADVYSTMPASVTSPNSYGRSSGTSMSTPVVTGIAALLTEQWRRLFSADPRVDELKALLIAGARDLGTAGPDATFGFGLADAKASIDLILADGGRRDHVRRGILAQGEVFEMPLIVSSPQDVRVVVQWTDPEVVFLANDPITTAALVNDLDARVVGSAGDVFLPWRLDASRFDAAATRGENHVDNTEVIEIANAAPGVYRVLVTATRIADRSPQEFVVVANAPAAPAAAGPRRRTARR